MTNRKSQRSKLQYQKIVRYRKKKTTKKGCEKEDGTK